SMEGSVLSSRGRAAATITAWLRCAEWSAARGDDSIASRAASGGAGAAGRGRARGGGGDPAPDLLPPGGPVAMVQAVMRWSWPARSHEGHETDRVPVAQSTCPLPLEGPHVPRPRAPVPRSSTPL